MNARIRAIVVMSNDIHVDRGVGAENFLLNMLSPYDFSK